MNIDALHSALISLTLLSDELCSTQENLSNLHDDNEIALTHFLSTIERDLRVAKAALASELGFSLCQCCWPPELLVTDADGGVACSGQLQTKDSEETGAASWVRLDAPAIPRQNGGWRLPDRGRLAMIRRTRREWL